MINVEIPRTSMNWNGVDELQWLRDHGVQAEWAVDAYSILEAVSLSGFSGNLVFHFPNRYRNLAMLFKLTWAGKCG
jgi:hypothetical protein